MVHGKPPSGHVGLTRGTYACGVVAAQEPPKLLVWVRFLVGVLGGSGSTPDVDDLKGLPCVKWAASAKLVVRQLNSLGQTGFDCVQT